MAHIDSALFDLGRLDRLARETSPIHRLDPRTKLLTTLVFLLSVMSFDRYTVSGLLPFLLYPMALIIVAGLPPGYLARKLLVVAPFALLAGAANPWFDTAPAIRLGPLSISYGWLSFTSILLRFLLTVTAALVLIATTSFHGVCVALRRLGLPSVMTVQLLLAYRYLFVLIHEGARMNRARSLRSFRKRGLGPGAYTSLIGHLLLRAVDRARRIHQAMLSRGFTGELHSMACLRFRLADLAYLVGWSALFLALRLGDLPGLFGRIATG